MAGLFGSRVANALLISESGLHKLIMRSTKPEARAFQDRVTRDVLPAIRKPFWGTSAMIQRRR
jgi:prophage antirepressor-like protein